MGPIRSAEVGPWAACETSGASHEYELSTMIGFPTFYLEKVRRLQ